MSAHRKVKTLAVLNNVGRAIIGAVVLAVLTTAPAQADDLLLTGPWHDIEDYSSAARAKSAAQLDVPVVQAKCRSKDRVPVESGAVFHKSFGGLGLYRAEVVCRTKRG